MSKLTDFCTKHLKKTRKYINERPLLRVPRLLRHKEQNKLPDVIYSLKFDVDNQDLFWAAFRRFYYDTLIFDPQWHLFHEGRYNELRVSQSFLQRTLDWLHENNYDPGPHLPEVWIDGSPTVEAYKEDFTAIFHSFSVMNMRNHARDPSPERMFLLSDRVAHCWFNMQHYTYMSLSFPPSYEMDGMAKLTTSRSFYEGILFENRKQIKAQKAANDYR